LRQPLFINATAAIPESFTYFHLFCNGLGCHSPKLGGRLASLFYVRSLRGIVSRLLMLSGGRM
jgi:hypothetical protein